VLEVGRMGAHAFAKIAYGTTSTGKANRGYEISIGTIAGMAMAGIDQPTRFVGYRRVTVTLDSTLFRMPRGSKTPVIGRLDDAGLERMDALRTRLWAERDMAAARRDERLGVTAQGVPVIRRSGATLSCISKGGLAPCQLPGAHHQRVADLAPKAARKRAAKRGRGLLKQARQRRQAGSV
jgi:hypothetical protein